MLDRIVRRERPRFGNEAQAARTMLAMEEARPRIIGGIRRREAYDQTKHAKKKPAVAGSVVVEVSGLEPLTPYMRKVEDEKEEPPPLSDDDQDRADGKRRS